MAKISTFLDELEKIEYVVIQNDDGSVTSMPKSVYDTLPSELVEPAPAEKPKK